MAPPVTTARMVSCAGEAATTGDSTAEVILGVGRDELFFLSLSVSRCVCVSLTQSLFLSLGMMLIFYCYY